MGLVAALLAILTPLHDALQKPEIHGHAGTVAQPFELRFSLRNPSWLLSMDDMEFKCVLPKLLTDGDTELLDTTLAEAGVSATISPGGTIEYNCPVARILKFPRQNITFAQVRITTHFKTLGVARAARSELFTWTTQSQQWIEGDIVN